MMLFGDVANLLRHFVLPQHLRAVAGMCNNNFLAEVGSNMVMRIFHIPLIFDKIIRALCLPDIVVKRTDTAQQAIGADRFGRGFRQVPHHHAVVVRTRGFRQQFSQQRVIRVGQLHQFQRGQDAESDFKKGKQSDYQHGGQQAASE